MVELGLLGYLKSLSLIYAAVMAPAIVGERWIGVTGRSGDMMLNKLLKAKVMEFKCIYMILASICNISPII